jgi:hypothetical protein
MKKDKKKTTVVVQIEYDLANPERRMEFCSLLAGWIMNGEMIRAMKALEAVALKVCE